MTDIKAQDVVDMFNTYIKDVLNRNIRWGSNSHPPTYNDGQGSDVYSDLFTGPTSGVPNAPNTGELTGPINQSELRSLMVDYAGYYTVIRRVNLTLRYRYNEQQGSYSSGSSVGPTQYDVFASGSGIAHVNNSYRTNVPDPGSISGNRISRSATINWFKQLQNAVINIRNQTISVNEEYCHTSCHSSCHDRCHGDSPGTGDGSDGGGQGSDRQLKTHIHKIVDALSKVQQIDTVTYQWNDQAKLLGLDQHGLSAEHGFIAQNVQQILPEAVTVSNDGYLQVDYARVSVLLAAAIKDLVAENGNMQRELNQVQNDIKTIKQALEV